jgi:hypothetical protein
LATALAVRSWSAAGEVTPAHLLPEQHRWWASRPAPHFGEGWNDDRLRATTARRAPPRRKAGALGAQSA